MIGIPFVKSLFGAILDVSKVIDGRFHICPYWGQEINKLNIEEIVSWVQPYLDTKQKYPVAILMPFREVGNFQYQNDASPVNAYSTWECSMAFLAGAYTTGQNQVSGRIQDTNQASHTIPDTWHDMARCAKDFMQVLENGISAQGLQTTLFISANHQQQILEVTSKGNDEVTGVLLRFYLMVFSGCDIEDYPADYLTEIQWPDVADTHPLHLDV